MGIFKEIRTALRKPDQSELQRSDSAKRKDSEVRNKAFVSAKTLLKNGKDSILPTALPTGREISLEAEGLCKRNERYREQINDWPKTIDAIRRVKRAANLRDCMDRLDQAVFRSYYRRGGILFYGTELVNYAEQFLPQEDTVEDLWVAAYNSAVRHMCDELAELETDCAAIRADAEKKIMVSTADAIQTIGWVDCSREIRFFRDGSYLRSDDAQVQLFLRRLRRAVTCNQNAAREAERCRSAALTQDEPKMRYGALLEAMRTALNQTACAGLASPEGQTVDEYRQSVKEYVLFLRRTLLDQYDEEYRRRAIAAIREERVHHKGT